MKTICFYFQIHQPYRLKRYRFFNIGRDHYYYDDYSNEDIMQQIAARSFVPANRMLLDLIRSSKGKFRVAISVSGVALDQMEVYAPEVIDGLKELSKTGRGVSGRDLLALSQVWPIQWSFRTSADADPKGEIAVRPETDSVEKYRNDLLRRYRRDGI